MTKAQRNLLERVECNAPKRMRVHGSDLVTARNLERLGLVKLTIGGSRIPWAGRWWYEITPVAATSANES